MNGSTYLGLFCLTFAAILCHYLVIDDADDNDRVRTGWLMILTSALGAAAVTVGVWMVTS